VSDIASVSWRASSGPPAAEFELLLFDLDGVVYVGPDAVPHAVESLRRAAEAGVRCSFTTNNAGRPPEVVAGQLRELGIAARDEDVVTSAQEGADRLASRLPPGSHVLAVGGPGVGAALRESGLSPVDRFADGVVGVLQGYGPDVSWRELAEASYAVAAGADWVATNPDLTIPTPRGTAPGNGQLTAVVQRTTGVDPEVTGKPGPGLFQLAVRRSGGGRALVVGDRLDTDIAGGARAGLPSLLVLTGVSGAADLLAARREERPTYLAEDLRGLWESHPAVQPDGDWWVSGGARAQVREGRLELAESPDQGRLDRLRAAAAAVWAAVDAGVKLDLGAVVDRLTTRDG
jgi:glycerol 3-phosphatase-2